MAGENSGLTPDYETSQSIYGLNDDFFALFLGPTMGYTCAVAIATCCYVFKHFDREIPVPPGRPQRPHHSAVRQDKLASAQPLIKPGVAPPQQARRLAG